MSKILADVAIIGAGTAGCQAYEVAKENGLKPILIDKGPIGSTSIRTGCVPTQILRELATKINKIETPATLTLYGKTPEARISRDNIMELFKKQRLSFIEDFVKNIYLIPENERIAGQARFIDSHTLEIVNTDITVQAKTIIIATGSRPYIPSQFNDIGDRLLTTDNIFDLKELPKSMAILGSGSVALELGQIFTDMGVKIAIFGKDSLWNFTDQKVAAEAYEALRSKTYISINSELTDYEINSDYISLYYLNESIHECLLNVEYLFCATGRIPNIHDLAIENSGIAIDDRGMLKFNPVNMQTNVPHIFIAGDACDVKGTLQNAITQGSIVGKNVSNFLSGDWLENIKQPTQQIIFTTPQLAIVGKSLFEINEDAKKGYKYIIGEGGLKNNKSAQIQNLKYGLVHVYFAQDDGSLLGAELCCPNAGSICQFLNSAIFNHMKLKDLKDLTFYHPSPFEILSEALKDAAHKFKLLVK